MNVTVWEERFAEYLELCGRSPATIRAYRFELRRFLGFLVDRGVQGVHEITKDELEAYQVRLHRRRRPDGRPITAGTRNARLSAVLSFLGFLTEGHYLLVNPGRDVRRPRVPRRILPQLPDEEQVENLLVAPDTTNPLGLRDRAMLELLYSSALRNRELRMLAVEDVDLARLWVRVLHGKGDKQRMVPLGEPAAAWIEEYLRRGRGFLVTDEGTSRLFLSLRGEPLSGEALSDIVRRHAGAAGLPMRVTPHILRHACATHMLARQARLRHLQVLLGHDSPNATQRYTQVQLDDLREVHQRCHPREAL
ncbi:MAG: tyrosine-type recombinase/integrase [Armatimonadetes bacterium]|nr:tyrosine-type recombinase/integrase [Armatimonadota bacterium]